MTFQKAADFVRLVKGVGTLARSVAKLIPSNALEAGHGGLGMHAGFVIAHQLLMMTRRHLVAVFGIVSVLNVIPRAATNVISDRAFGFFLTLENVLGLVATKLITSIVTTRICLLHCRIRNHEDVEGMKSDVQWGSSVALCVRLIPANCLLFVIGCKYSHAGVVCLYPNLAGRRPNVEHFLTL